MPFDPNQPFETVAEQPKPKFDPNRPFEPMESVKKKDQGSEIGDSGKSYGTLGAPSEKNGSVDPLGLIKGTYSENNIPAPEDKEQDDSVWGGIKEYARTVSGSLEKGWKQGEQAAKASEAWDAKFGLDLANRLSKDKKDDTYKKVYDQKVSELNKLSDEAEKVHESESVKEYDQAKTNSEAWEAFKKNPVDVVTSIVLKSASQLAANTLLSKSGDSMPGMTALEAPAPNVPLLMAEKTYKLGMSSDMMGTLQESGVDLKNPDAVKEAFSDDKKMADIKENAKKRNIPIAMVDAVTGGIASKVAGKIVSRPLAALAGLGIEAIGGGVGELAGQINSGQEVDARSIAEEVLGGIGSGAPNVATGMVSSENTQSPAVDPSGETGTIQPQNEQQGTVPVPEQVQQQAVDPTGAQPETTGTQPQEPGDLAAGQPTDQGTQVDAAQEIPTGLLDQPSTEDTEASGGTAGVLPLDKGKQDLAAVEARSVPDILSLSENPDDLVAERLKDAGRREDVEPVAGNEPVIGVREDEQGGTRESGPDVQSAQDEVRAETDVRPEEPGTATQKERKFSIRSRLSKGPSEVLKSIAKKDPDYYRVLNTDETVREADKMVSEDIDAAIEYVMEPDKKISDTPKMVAAAGSILRVLEENYRTAPKEAKAEIRQTIDNIRKKVGELSTTSGQGINLMKQVGDTLPLADRMAIMAESVVEEKTKEYLGKTDIEGDIKKEIEPFVKKSIDQTVNESQKVKDLEKRIFDLEEIISSKKTLKRKEAIKKAVDKLDGMINKGFAYSDAVGLVAITKEGLRLIKATIVAGGKVADAIDRGVRYINAKANGQKWDEARFRADLDEQLADSRATLDELYDKKEAVKEARRRLKDATRSGLESGDFTDLTSLLEEKEMDPEEIESYIKSIKEKHEDQVVLETAKRIEKNLGLKPKSDPKVESLARKIANGQPLTDLEKTELIKKKYKIPVITLEQKERILELSEEIGRVFEDPDLKMEAVDNLRHELQKLYPRNKFENFQNWFDSVIWYPNMLSGISTSALNIKDALFNTLSIGYLARKGGREAFIDQFRALARSRDKAIIGARQGFLNSSTMYNMDAPDSYDIKRKTAEDFAKEGNTVAKYWSRWVGRAMAVPNILNAANKYSALSFMIQSDLRKQGVPAKEIAQRKNEILWGAEDLRKEFAPKAIELVYGDSPRDGSDKLKEAKVRRTVENMVLDRINGQVFDADGRSAMEVANEIAETATYQNKATGFAGLLSKHIQKALGTGIPGSIIKKVTGIDFVNTTFNVINAAANYSPYGYFRANGKSFSRIVDFLIAKGDVPNYIKDSVGYTEARSKEEQARILQKANTSSAILATVGVMAIAAAADDDDDDLVRVTGSMSPKNPINDPSKLHQKKTAYAKSPPYSIYIPGVGWTSYLGTPLAGPLSFIGNTCDYIRSEKDKGTTTEEVLEGMGFGMVGSMKSTVWDNTPMRHLTDRASMQKNIDTGNFTDELANFAIANGESFFGNMVPNLVKQVGKMIDPTVYTPKDMAGRLAKATAIINYASLFGEDTMKKGFAVDVLGNRVTSAPGEKYFNTMMRKPSEDDQKYYDILYDAFRTPSQYPPLISPQTAISIPLEKQQEVDKKLNANQELFRTGKIDFDELQNRNNEINKKAKKLDDLGNDPWLYAKANTYRGEEFKKELDKMNLEEKTTEQKQDHIRKALNRSGKKAIKRLQKELDGEE
jgi:hypothetical protein